MSSVNRKKPSLKNNSRYHQGIYRPQNPSKYIGDCDNIIYRSGLELRLLRWLDTTPGVIKYASEEIVIPYLSPIDNRPHRYFTDIWMEIRDNTGKTRKILIEVKPYSQTKPPILKETQMTKKQKERQVNDQKTWLVNKAKWNAAIAFCQKNGMEFSIITEKDLGGY